MTCPAFGSAADSIVQALVVQIEFGPGGATGGEDRRVQAHVFGQRERGGKRSLSEGQNEAGADWFRTPSKNFSFFWRHCRG